MDAIEYFKEKKRMLNSLGRISGMCDRVNCKDCPLSCFNNKHELTCSAFEIEYPEEAIAIVEKWSEEHPQKTMLMDFLEKYPKARLDDDGLPDAFCPYDLGYEDDESDCPRHWDKYKVSSEDNPHECLWLKEMKGVE